MRLMQHSTYTRLNLGGGGGARGGGGGCTHVGQFEHKGEVCGGGGGGGLGKDDGAEGRSF